MGPKKQNFLQSAWKRLCTACSEAFKITLRLEATYNAPKLNPADFMNALPHVQGKNSSTAERSSIVPRMRTHSHTAPLT